MKKSLASGVGVAAALMVVFGAGSAGAINEYAGSTYEKAAEYISNAGRTAVIATRIGEYLPTEKCVVTGSRNASGGKVLLDLNCNDTSALNGHSGNSVATPEGRKAKALRDVGVQISEGFAQSQAAGKPSWCEQNVAECKRNCEVDGVNCSAEVMQFLGL